MSHLRLVPPQLETPPVEVQPNPTDIEINGALAMPGLVFAETLLTCFSDPHRENLARDVLNVFGLPESGIRTDTNKRATQLGTQTRSLKATELYKKLARKDWVTHGLTTYHRKRNQLLTNPTEDSKRVCAAIHLEKIRAMQLASGQTSAEYWPEVLLKLDPDFEKLSTPDQPRTLGPAILYLVK